MNTIEAGEKLKTIIYGNGRVSWSTAEKIATDISNQWQQSQQDKLDTNYEKTVELIKDKFQQLQSQQPEIGKTELLSFWHWYNKYRYSPEDISNPMGMEGVINKYISENPNFQSQQLKEADGWISKKKMKKQEDINRQEYLAIHSWLKYRYGKAEKCENETCKHISTKFEWALRKGFNYKRDRESFIQLCKRCHIAYDNHKPEQLHSLRNEECMDRINKAKLKKVEQYTSDGRLVKIWDSLTQAAYTLGINRNSISTSISRKSKYKNSIWKLQKITNG